MDDFSVEEDTIIENYLKRKNKDIHDNYFDFCPKCNIIFTSYNMHRILGCTDNIYTASFVKKFKFKNKEYNGMPQFENKEELFTVLKNDMIDFLEYEDTNDGKGSCSWKSSK